ncbi:GDSL-type esterase/lipase family protein [Crossiella cryophila]|uniref:Lysophospholipase L1-like esterase n=1 Tax=Crossiella cryophila TaxID=43355 RepID=A0A7W7FUZ9_9PSEU|nr:GDSL-type esterase/lipase family protein [Crossiella cryophila]MBB4678742.1 lysophospholipase L1-like esterase [Crossiella cryophila]
MRRVAYAAATVLTLLVGVVMVVRGQEQRVRLDRAGEIAVLGASISGAESAWPDRLGLTNQSLSASRLLTDNGPGLPSALHRLDSAIRPGVRAVLLTDLINDIQQEPHQYDPEIIIAGLREFLRQAHRRGIQVIGTTITPYGGFLRYEPDGERTRQAVNHFIRHSGEFDLVLDFDAAVRDAAAPERLRPEFDSGDHLHPNAAGQRRLAAVATETLG